MLAGRFFQTRSIERNRQQLQQDQDEMDWVMIRLTEDGQEPVSVQHLQSGDQLLIPMGGVIPVDAVLMSPNQVRLSLAWITGESESVEFTVGTEIASGAINSSGHPIEVVATQEWADSELKQLLTLPPGRESEDVPEWFRPILKWYVPIVFALAGLGVALWWSTGVKPALQVMTALLIVTCPCAFGIALPLAKEIAVLKLRTIGVFIRSERFFARAHQIKRVVFDKTGTITLGRLTVHTTDDLSPVDLQVLYNMVSRSSHPKSQALMTWATRQLDTPERRVDFPLTEDPGIGLFHADYRLIGDADLDTVLVRGDNQIASFQFSEGLRGDMFGIFDSLKHAGVEVSVLSGDRPERVQQAMSQIGVSDIEAIGGLSPQDKSDWILSHHPAEILMVGDGLNDAKAFDVAALSVTPANNLAGLLSRADVYVTGDNLRCIGQALQSVQHTTRVQKQVFLGALVYNVIAIGFSFMGWMTPLWAAILMPISSISLVSFTLFAQQSMLEEK
jgi:Cu2+-exporting ATPase